MAGAGSVTRPGPERVYSAVARRLGVDIISGALMPGQRLPTEAELAAAMQVSRGAYREGIRILAAAGLIQSRSKTGTRVNPRDQWNLLDPDVLAWHFEVQPSLHYLESLFDLRAIIEPAAAERAALRRSDADLVAMQAALDRMAAAGRGRPEALQADIDFHRAIVQATRNEPLATMVSLIASTLRWTVTLTVATAPAAQHDAIPSHRAVLEAIRAQMPGVARETMAHLISISRRDTVMAVARRDASGPATASPAERERPDPGGGAAGGAP